MEWLQLIGGLITGAVGGAALYDRWLRFRNQMTGDIEIAVLPGTVELPGENPWDPPVIQEDVTDGIVVRATVHNNTSGPIVIREWVVEGPPMVGGSAYVGGETIQPGQTEIASTMFVPDWAEWDRRLDRGLTSRAEPTVRISLVALSRATSRRLTLRGVEHSITDEIVKSNVLKASSEPGTPAS